VPSSTRDKFSYITPFVQFENTNLYRDTLARCSDAPYL